MFSVLKSRRDHLVRHVFSPSLAKQGTISSGSLPTIAISFGVESKKSAAERAYPKPEG